MHASYPDNSLSYFPGRIFEIWVIFDDFSLKIPNEPHGKSVMPIAFDLDKGAFQS